MDRKCQELFDNFMKFTIDESPEFITYKGLSTERQDELDPYTVDMYHKRKLFYEDMLKKITLISRDAISDENLISLDVLEYSLSTAVKGLEYQAYLMPVNFWEGVDQYFINYTLPRTRFTTVPDHLNYIKRLEAFPSQVKQVIQLMREGIDRGIVCHKETIGEIVTNRLQRYVENDFEKLPHYKPFQDCSKAFGVDSKLMKTCVQDPLRELYDFIQQEYKPWLRADNSINLMPGGTQDRYKAYLQYYCDTDMSPQDMHQLGCMEVDKLKNSLYKVMKQLKYDGTTKEFAKYIEKEKNTYFADVKDIKPHCEFVINEVIRPKLNKIFKDFEDVPFQIIENQLKTTARGVYTAPPADNSSPGFIILNVSSDFARYEVLPLMLHEIIPGHHLQACVIQNNTSLPQFRTLKDDRRYFEAPGRTPVYSAYTEGWGLYCEDLGHELGLYDDPYAEYGYLYFNFVRAVRIVLDTGIHAMGWTKEDARDYIETHAPIASQALTEFARFITWPGQACAYTFGFLKIKELRAKAEKELGSLFDIKEFHQQCLDCGPVPLSTLELIINRYIQKTK